MFTKSKTKAPDTTPEKVTTVSANTSTPSMPSPSEPAPTPSNSFFVETNKTSVISEGFSLVGDITAQGTLHVEGSLKGTISTESVNIGIQGTVEGKVQCNSLHIKGVFAGTGQCDELLIASKAKVMGKISYRVLTINRGASVEGELKLME